MAPSSGEWTCVQISDPALNLAAGVWFTAFKETGPSSHLEGPNMDMEVHPMSILVKQLKRAGLIAALVSALGLTVAATAVAGPADCKHCAPDAAAAPQDKPAKPDAPKGDDKAAKGDDHADQPKGDDKADKPKGDKPDGDHGPKGDDQKGPKGDGDKPGKGPKGDGDDKPGKGPKPPKPPKPCKGHKCDAPTIVIAAPAPVEVAPQQAVLSQQLKACASRRALTIHIRRHRGVHYRSATVTLNGKRIATRRGKRISAPISLKGLPKGTYRLVIRVVTTKGKVIRGTRIYHTCVGPMAAKHTPKL